MEVHRILALRGAAEALENLRERADEFLPRERICQVFHSSGVEEPDALLDMFANKGFLLTHEDRYRITRRGVLAHILLNGLNTGDLREVHERIDESGTASQTYRLLRSEMTRVFITNLNERPGFARLYICSPWINLDDRLSAYLFHALQVTQSRTGVTPEVLVITRPDKRTAGIPSTLEPFLYYGASVYLHHDLHAKLYIREPGLDGGYSMAIVGSQNLTRSNYIELGIQVNSDGQLISQMIAFFLDTAGYCQRHDSTSTLRR